MPAAYFWHPEAPRTVSPHSESGGRTSPAPPTKAIAHPFFGHFSAGGFWHHDLRAIIFGRGFARGLFLVPRGTSQSLVPFRVRRTNFARAPHQGYSPPVFGHFSAGGSWHPDLRGLIFGRGCARGLFLAHGGRPPSLGPFRVPRTNFAHAPHQGYSPPVFWPFFRWGVLGPRPSGADFWARLCPWPIFGTQRPPAKYGAIPSPADELRPRPPPRL